MDVGVSLLLGFCTGFSRRHGHCLSPVQGSARCDVCLLPSGPVASSI